MPGGFDVILKYLLTMAQEIRLSQHHGVNYMRVGLSIIDIVDAEASEGQIR
jgi:hypothetical protein